MMKITGLSSEEVECWKKSEENNEIGTQTITKTTAQIWKENVFTLFNLLNFFIAALLFSVGAYSNMLFIAIIIVNILIGTAQEWKAKKLVEQLSILNRPQAVVMRDGMEQPVTVEDLVPNDVMILSSGQQICSDATIISGSIEVNESLLTGESDGVIKEEGDCLLSGSFVISGKCYARIIHIGSKNYAERLANEVKREKKVESELLNSIKKVTRFTSALIFPLGILLFLEAYLLRTAPADIAVVSSAAALLGMLPKGLVLLISAALLNGVIRLSKRKILVQNIYALETLAHVDVLCLDKTGTLTDGKLKVRDVLYLDGLSRQFESEKWAEELLSSYLSESDDNNATIQALRERFSYSGKEKAVYKIPFSSKRKWGAVSFGEKGTIFIGAPERLIKEPLKQEEYWLNMGYRVVAAGYCPEEWRQEDTLPEKIQPLYLVALEDHVRQNAKETLEYFDKEGVDIRIISGDHVKTVSMTAKQAGLRRWDEAIDLSTLGENIDYGWLCRNYTVFARVTPKQKLFLIQELKNMGHCVAMTGDGVNDLLALREADCSIAVAQGSDASRQVSQIVLLESDFTHLLQVLLEGRRVVNHITRTAGVFFIKTIYSFLLTVFCLLANTAFPFIPIQITLVDAAMEAWPSFLTIFESHTEKIKDGFLKTALGNAAPFAFTITSMIMFVKLFLPFPEQQSQTVMYILLILTTMVSVIKSCVPFTKLRLFICSAMIAGTFGGLAVLPSLFEVVPITRFMAVWIGIVFCMGMVLLWLLLKARQVDYTSAS